jgi:transcriptional regulator with XRE-family HTH domain
MCKKKQLKSIFSGNLKRLMAHNRITQKTVCDALDTTPRTYRRWADCDDDHWPHASKLSDIAKLFHCSIDDLYEHDPAFLPQTSDERELLMVSRMANPDIPRRQVINAITSALGRLSPANRKLWLDIGSALAEKS